MRSGKNVKQFIDNSKEFKMLKEILDILGDKWSILILMCVFNEPKRFTEIETFVDGISPRTLTLKLTRLTQLGMIEKKKYNEFPPRTEYQATKMAKELRIAFQELKIWAKKYSDKNH